MIWLASYPRSGNTFLRIILYEVYGIESSAFHINSNRKLALNYSEYEVVKTHLLPDQLIPNDSSIPAVYLMRDGRDSIVSMAHHAIDIVKNGNNLNQIMKEAILAKKGSYFGGWSNNVEAWLRRADVILKFEDMIKEPINSVEKFRKVIDLPKPVVEKLPTFEDLQTKRYKYGSRSAKKDESQQNEHRKKFFRKGKSGSWREEMPDDLQELFWKHHGKTMKKMGYTEGVMRPSVIRSIIRKMRA